MPVDLQPNRMNSFCHGAKDTIVGPPLWGALPDARPGRNDYETKPRPASFTAGSIRETLPDATNTK